MTGPRVLIAGGGIGGLAVALTLHQIGVPFTVLEGARELAPLGVGINLQPNAVRELDDLGIGPDALDRVGVATREWALVGRNGHEIYSEPRGLLAGYRWPQYAVHRGQLQLLLARTLRERAGAGAIRLGHRVTGYETHADGSVTATGRHADGTTWTERGTLLIGADGIHSAVRAQMHPDQPPIHWGGTLMWRGTTQARPIRTGSSFVGVGSARHRVVVYPISAPDPGTGLATINWIAELTVDATRGRDSGWFREVAVEEFAHHFADWTYDWLDVPDLLRRAEVAYENPMIDRDPVPTWQDGPVLLVGDAAHAMYPTGSNGAGQAIVDARVLGAAILDHGPTPDALAAVDARLCGPVSQLVLRNRGAGPFGLLDLVDERCGGDFDDIDDVVPAAERAAFMAGYKAAAGFAIEQLNAAGPTIPPGARHASRSTAGRREDGSMRARDVVFVHGAGRHGPAAWPQQAAAAEPGWLFLTREGVADDAARDARRLLGWLRARGGGHVVAHSYGANAAVLAAQLEPALVRSLALLEPACFDLARGRPAVEEHIAAMTPVFEAADDPSVSARDFSLRFAAGMGTEPPDVPDEQLRASVDRLRALRPPWGIGLRTQQGLPARTLVVTGGSSRMYEETAEALVALGAQHVALEGAGHRVQDDPRAPEVLTQHWAG
ncbi:FAD-dependent monooxygenase [Cellulomonas wangsupingiae]|uniref:FAD-dependent monooxygenase n=1 Tax=Cellulomonas wangsupingiae TaxID=2968085 RepID=UPI001D0EF661|nr:FAD-dependent monooxygenase [Cellulomonas wangsupingiae]MCM0638868.1 FAD-dependent monooxygenase [Cellulomonas wangsupingiae]